MEHDLGLPAMDQVGHGRVADVEALEREPMAALGPGIGQVGQRSGGQIVDHVDAVALGDEAVDEVRPDEPGTACDEGLHATRPATCSSPPPTSAPPPTTVRSERRAPSPTTARSPTIECSTMAPVRTSDPGRSTESCT